MKLIDLSTYESVLVRFIVLSLSSVPSLAFGTTGYFSHAYGTKAEGVAGVSIALPQDTLSIASNPAGLTDISDSIDVDISAFQPDREATLVQGGQARRYSGNDTKTFLIPAFGYVRHLSERVAVGVAVYGNGGMNTDYAKNPFARFGAQGSAGVDLSQAFLSPSVAWKVSDRHSFGIAANFAYQRFEAKGVGLFAGFSAAPPAVSDRGYDNSHGIGVRVGWQGRMTDRLTIGATWQSQIAMGKFSKYAGLFADKGGFDIPSSWGIGAAYDISPRWQVGADYQRIHYSNVASVGNSVASLFQGKPLGVTGGPGFGWRDVSVVRVGTILRVTDRLTLRAGASHNTQPIPAAETFFNVLAPGVVEVHATLGASWKLSSTNEISASVMHAFERTVNGAGSIPSSFGGGEANVSLAETSIGVGISHRF